MIDHPAAISQQEPRDAEPYQVRQWSEIYGLSGKGMGRYSRHRRGLCRAQFAIGEWLLREFQRKASGRTAHRQDLIQPCRNEDCSREQAPPLQNKAPALLARLSPSRKCSNGRLPSAASYRHGAVSPAKPAVALAPVMH